MILGLQRRTAEVGRIRLGVKTTGSNGKERPTKLDRLRFTSARKDLIEKVAVLYGGTVEPWHPARGNAQWEVITQTDSVPVMVPPQDPAESQWYEAWSAGGCQRRCNGQREMISGGACLCDPDRRDCQMHTRIRVMLKEIPGIGVWRVDTGSYYAALELPGVTEFLAQAEGVIPGRLTLDQRTVTRAGMTKKFAVPVLDVEGFTPDEILSGRVPALVAARAAAAIDAATADTGLPAIAAGPDLASLIATCDSKDELTVLWKRFGCEGLLNDDLEKVFKARADEIAELPVDAEIVEEPAGW
jgi:hypothetical protein